MNKLYYFYRNNFISSKNLIKIFSLSKTNRNNIYSINGMPCFASLKLASILMNNFKVKPIYYSRNKYVLKPEFGHSPEKRK